MQATKPDMYVYEVIVPYVWIQLQQEPLCRCYHYNYKNNHNNIITAANDVKDIEYLLGETVTFVPFALNKTWIWEKL